MTGNSDRTAVVHSFVFSPLFDLTTTFVCLVPVDKLNNATVSGVINGLIFGAVLMFIIVIGILQKERVRCL